LITGDFSNARKETIFDSRSALAGNKEMNTAQIKRPNDQSQKSKKQFARLPAITKLKR